MALKALLLKKQIDNMRKQLKTLQEKRDAYKTREAELAADIDNAEAIDADVEAAVAAFEAERDENETAISNLEGEIAGLESDLAAEEAAQRTEPPAGAGITQTSADTNIERSENHMNTRELPAQMNLRDRVAAIVTREDTVGFLATVRAAMTEKRAISNVGVLIPETMLELIRTEIARGSRLLSYVRLVNVSGEARQPITGSIPEAVWTQCCANLNEIDLGFNQIEVDCWKVGAYMAVCNATLEDSDVALATEIVSALGTAIAKALDKAILFGNGVKMPLGIATRLAETSQPEDWGALAPAWTDLHTTNIKKLNIDSSTGAAFFSELIANLAIAKDKTNAGGLVWVMNRTTHLHIMAKALAFDSSAALVANTTLMPIIGGTVVEFEDDQIANNEIIGGYFGNYLMAQRAAMKIGSSDIPLFLQDQTVFKATARYDGMPVFGEAFVIVNFANVDPTTTATFPEDYANADMNDLIVTAAVGTAAGDTVLTVSGTLAQSDPVLKYKLGVPSVNVGDVLPAGFATLTSGTTQITAAAGKKITVVELDANSRIVSAGVVASVPKT